MRKKLSITEVTGLGEIFYSGSDLKYTYIEFPTKPGLIYELENIEKGSDEWNKVCDMLGLRTTNDDGKIKENRG